MPVAEVAPGFPGAARLGDCDGAGCRGGSLMPAHTRHLQTSLRAHLVSHFKKTRPGRFKTSTTHYNPLYEN